MNDLPRLVLVSNRRLDDVRSGSGAYLVTFLKSARKAGFSVRLVMAPDTAFGSRPWAKIAPGVAQRTSPEWPYTKRFRGNYVSLLPAVWLRFIRRLGVEARRRLGLGGEVKSLLSQIPARGELRAIAKAVRLHDPACVVVEYSSLAPLFDHLSDIRGRGVLMHDLFSSRADSFRAAGKALDHGDMTVAEEAERLRAANLILHASMNELQKLSPLAAQAKHVWMRPTTKAQRDALQTRAPAALFMGADHAGNREALAHLLEDIWPRVRAQIADARLIIAGAVGNGLAAQDGVEPIGPVDDLATLAGPDRIGLAPIRVSSGVAIKVADYMGLGMPVIGYPGGLDGFGAELDAAAVRVQTPEAFADALINLLNSSDERRARSEAGLKLAETTLSDSGIITALNAFTR